MNHATKQNGLHHPDRRLFLAGGAALGLLPLLPKGTFAAETYRFNHGDFDLTVLSDGFLTLPAEILLPDATAEERFPILKRLGGDAKSAPVQVNIPLIRKGNELILVDIGSGGNFQESAGKLATNLKASGVDPASITKVVFTHAHPDHSGATVAPDGKLLYPNAEYLVSEAEWAFWTDADFDKKQPEALHGFAQGAKRDLFAVKDRMRLVSPGDEIVAGMRVLDTRGHTPGHISLHLDGGDGLIITGDAATSNVIFFEHPDWHFGFDTEAEIALKNRKALIEQAATDKVKMLGYHWAYPGVGFAERKDNAYVFVAA
ncbi:MBL fold metallo-hydrolase [Rhizobiaceae bacterium n13]|uniref:MBL fold metallo-hydrolase n=1 Tax=Ferirhizobium litorale TaxID=2927786 RepID=A0AAE3QKE7_9HYPH|nr:MBL fold metallo-hydrolase [Fererhizobium litorale]MDI7864768.1 MBL fold metallo-hydrolase [Fererhizobium litorale]MDI7924951.1 MBL fold metallo-hydrolase [Fererhizobium litorale]